ncbi:MAG: hypothetical protein KY391_01940 [Actinobacteria bacterium]|nr:hypothetical protein [Actinomycetota bacterium]
MHEALHISILAATILGAASLALLVLWPVLFDAPMPRSARALAVGAVVAAGLLLLVEWRLVH